MAGISALTLSDGRLLEYRVSGPDGGLPLVFHHGTPGSVIPLRTMERAAHARGLRFVTMSRAGYGGSTRQPGRMVIDVVADTAELLASLGADRALVAGWSGGGPHALACAARLPGVLGALVIAGVAPGTAADLDFLEGMGDDNVEEFGEAAAGEQRLRTYLDGIRPGLAEVQADQIVAEMASVLPEIDRAVLTDEFGEDLAAAFREALRIGIDGWLDDDLAFLRDWGFDLSEISVPTTLWQGTADLMVPTAHGRWFSEHMPSADVRILQDEGHLSVLLGAVDQMMDALVASS